MNIGKEFATVITSITNVVTTFFVRIAGLDTVFLVAIVTACIGSFHSHFESGIFEAWYTSLKRKTICACKRWTLEKGTGPNEGKNAMKWLETTILINFYNNNIRIMIRPFTEIHSFLCDNMLVISFLFGVILCVCVCLGLH